jgi:carbamate kinase
VTAVVALGGNALMRPGERGTAAEQRANLREACDALRPLLGEDELVITHGNGPQVGNELLRHERGAEEVPPLPLYLAVAQTQAEIGALIESELAPVAERPVACLLTHVVVDEADPPSRNRPSRSARSTTSRGRRSSSASANGGSSTTRAAAGGVSFPLPCRSRSWSSSRSGRFYVAVRSRSRAEAGGSRSRGATDASPASTP